MAAIALADERIAITASAHGWTIGLSQLDTRHRRLAVYRRLLDRLDHRQPLDDAAKHRVFPIERRRVPLTMKNDVVALAGSSPRAIERIPFTCGVSLNSGLRVWTYFRCFSVSGPRLLSAPAWTTKPSHDAMKGGSVEYP